MIAPRAAVLPITGHRVHVVLLAAEDLAAVCAAQTGPLSHGSLAAVTTRHRADVPEQLFR